LLPSKLFDMDAKEIREILKGIDQMQTESNDGWWETSTGAEFGKSKLNELIAKSKEGEIKLYDLVISELDDNTVSWRGANVILSEHYERIAENISNLAAFGKEGEG